MYFYNIKKGFNNSRMTLEFKGSYFGAAYKFQKSNQSRNQASIHKHSYTQAIAIMQAFKSFQYSNLNAYAEF